jgi:hypothetical protein
MGQFLNRHIKNITVKRTIEKISISVRVLIGKEAAGSRATVFPDDVYLTSYPRSGNTWTRFLLGNLLHLNDPASFTNIESRIPEIYFNADHVLRRLPRPRLLKSHEPFHPNYPQIIYIVRDPRDVAVSFYHHNIKAGIIADDYPMGEFIPGFIAGQYDPAWGSWGDHVMSWVTMRQGRGSFLLLRYEDMKENTPRELLKIVRFLQKVGFPDIESSPEKLARAVELSSPERMRALEKRQSRQFRQLRRTRQDKPFIRGAKAGGWQSDLAEPSVTLIENAWGPIMQSLGYPLSQTLQETEVARH